MGSTPLLLSGLLNPSQTCLSLSYDPVWVKQKVAHFCFISQNSTDVWEKQWLWENYFLMNYEKEIAEIMMGGSSFTLLSRSAS